LTTVSHRWGGPPPCAAVPMSADLRRLALSNYRESAADVGGARDSAKEAKVSERGGAAEETTARRQMQRRAVSHKAAYAAVGSAPSCAPLTHAQPPCTPASGLEGIRVDREPNVLKFGHELLVPERPEGQPLRACMHRSICVERTRPATPGRTPSPPRLVDRRAENACSLRSGRADLPMREVSQSGPFVSIGALCTQSTRSSEARARTRAAYRARSESSRRLCH
jgi:hypothetical protein